LAVGVYSGVLRSIPPDSGITVHFWQPLWQPLRDCAPPSQSRKNSNITLVRFAERIEGAEVNLKSKPQAHDGPEFIVTRELFNRYFEKPLPPATFYDKVDEGIILPWSGIKGRYFLNASLRRMGLPPERALPVVKIRNREDLVRLAFSGIDPLLFPPPSWLLDVDVINISDVAKAHLLEDRYRDRVRGYHDHRLQLAYFQGALDAAHLIDASPGMN